MLLDKHTLTGVGLILENTYYTPMTITLKSSDAGRKIELSTDGGEEYFTPAYDVSSATMLVVGVLTPVSHIKVTGAINDTVFIGS